jgi:hypothetical protein
MMAGPRLVVTVVPGQAGQVALALRARGIEVVSVLDAVGVVVVGPDADPAVLRGVPGVSAVEPEGEAGVL